MSKRFLSLALSPLLLAGCTSTFTNLTPLHQTRNNNNVYPVEVAMDSRQQSLRWNTIHPQILVGNEAFPMRQTPLMTNRWEGLIQVSNGTSVVHYRYKFDFDYGAFGKTKPDSAMSPEYTLHIAEP
ncbi:MAG TPA: hypothetical protein VKY92_04270 [Verrucomicrobiae bacterium]|nr:hypothetical protein [Verrucomicrobiae bacterium]